MNRRSFLRRAGGAVLAVVAAPLYIPSERLAFGVPRPIAVPVVPAAIPPIPWVMDSGLGEPAGPAMVGQLYYDLGESLLYRHDGRGWQAIRGPVAMAGPPYAVLRARVVEEPAWMRDPAARGAAERLGHDREHVRVMYRSSFLEPGHCPSRAPALHRA